MMYTNETKSPTPVTTDSEGSYNDEADSSVRVISSASPPSWESSSSVRHEPSFLVQFTGSFKDGAFDVGMEAGREMAEWTKSSDGCQLYEIYKSMDPERNRTILVFMEWRHEGYFQKQLPERLDRYNRHHPNCEKNSIHGMKWKKSNDVTPNPFLSPEMDLLTPEPLSLQDERGKAFYPCVALATMAKAKASHFEAFQLALSRIQAELLQRNDYGIIRFDIYVGAGDDNEGVNLVFAVFRTECDMESYLVDENVSLLNSSLEKMLEMAPHIAKWERAI